MTDPQSFVGREEIRRDYSDAGRITRLAATLDHRQASWSANTLPPLAHWIYFLPDARQSCLDVDGHPLRGDDGLLPSVDLPKRMWAGSRIRFYHPIPLNVPITRTSTLIAATPKKGRSGAMLFVTIRHEIVYDDGPAAIVEEQDVVYRAAADGSTFARHAVQPDTTDQMRKTIIADPVLLFRYSALTFNAHRIHFDRNYAQQQEGYPGLVVHGPLLATLMLDHLCCNRPGLKISSYEFRALSPVFDGESLELGASVDGPRARLRVVGPVGVAATATAEFAA